MKKSKLSIEMAKTMRVKNTSPAGLRFVDFKVLKIGTRRWNKGRVRREVVS